MSDITYTFHCSPEFLEKLDQLSKKMGQSSINLPRLITELDYRIEHESVYRKSDMEREKGLIKDILALISICQAYSIDSLSISPGSITHVERNQLGIKILKTLKQAETEIFRLESFLDPDSSEF